MKIFYSTEAHQLDMENLPFRFDDDILIYRYNDKIYFTKAYRIGLPPYHYTEFCDIKDIIDPSGLEEHTITL